MVRRLSPLAVASSSWDHERFLRRAMTSCVFICMVDSDCGYARKPHGTPARGRQRNAKTAAMSRQFDDSAELSEIRPTLRPETGPHVAATPRSGQRVRGRMTGGLLRSGG